MVEPVSPELGVPRAFLRVAGASLARHQLAVAHRLNCQRVICMARGTSAELIDLQRCAENGGLKFHIIADTRGLSGLVTSADELLVLCEGVLADPAIIAGKLVKQSCVLVQPADGAVEAGFERIDLNFAVAGIMIIPGRLAERLRELPADCDVVSTLTRIALQHDITRQEVPAALRTKALQMIRNEEEAHGAEQELLKRVLGGPSSPSPGHFLSIRTAILFGPALLHARNGVAVFAFLFLALLAGALVSGWFGLSALGLVMCAVGWVLLKILESLSEVNNRISIARTSVFSQIKSAGWLLDFAIVLILALQAPVSGDVLGLGIFFAPMMLMLLLRIAALAFEGWHSGYFGDRALLCTGLAAISVLGSSAPSVQILAVFAAVAVLIRAGKLQR